MAKERVAARTVKTDLVANLAMSFYIEWLYLESITIELECNFDDIKWNWSNSSNAGVGSISCFSLWSNMVSIIDHGPYSFCWEILHYIVLFAMNPTYSILLPTYVIHRSYHRLVITSVRISLFVFT